MKTNKPGTQAKGDLWMGGKVTRENIHERRAYIKTILDAGQTIDILGIARAWQSSRPSIVVDIAACQGRKDPYRKTQVQAQNQRAFRLNIEGRLSDQDWQCVLEKHGYACVNCGSKSDLAIDHIIPLSRGGKNVTENIQPLCRSCNTSKSDRTPEEWADAKAAARENGKRGGRPRKTSNV